MIKYIKGDALIPIGPGIKQIVHNCNDIGVWGAGFVLAVSKLWKGPEQEYRRITASKRKLGYVQYIPVAPQTYIVNMIAQNGTVLNEFGVPPVRYAAVHTCLKKVVNFVQSLDDGKTPVSIHMPIIGCGLAGGSWTVMEATIKDAVGECPVTVYDIGNVLDHSYFKGNLGTAFTTSHGVIETKDRREWDELHEKGEI